MKFFGIGGAGPQYVKYFLTRANHADPDTPIDVISLHHYAGSAARDGGNGTPGGDYEAFFPSGDGFISELVEAYANIAASDYPHVMIDADEVGVILGDDNDPKYTATDPGFPALYWNAAAAMYAYIFGRAATIGLDVLGESQLIGYPSIPFSRGAPYDGNWTAPPQYPSVSMLSWGGAFGQPGDGTARYWVLKLLVDEMKPGPPAGAFAPADADVLVNTTTAGGAAPLASPFCAEVLNLQTLSMFCATGVIDAVTFASYGTPRGACGAWAVNASCNAANSSAVVAAACVGKAACSVKADTPTFGDPCCEWRGVCGAALVVVVVVRARARGREAPSRARAAPRVRARAAPLSPPPPTSPAVVVFSPPLQRRADGTVKHLAVEATCSTGGGAQAGPPGVYAQAFVEAAGAGARKVLVVNKEAVPHAVSLAGAAGARWTYVDESTAFGPAASATLGSDTWTLAPFAAGVVRLAA